MDYRELVNARFDMPMACYGHCQGVATLRFVRDVPRPIACAACPSGYVSRVIVYGSDVDADDLKEFVSSAGVGGVKDEDIRVATRHPWDLSYDAEMREAYWTQSYRRTKDDRPGRPALFLCASCQKPFVQPLDSKGAVCPACGRR